MPGIFTLTTLPPAWIIFFFWVYLLWWIDRLYISIWLYRCTFYAWLDKWISLIIIKSNHNCTALWNTEIQKLFHSIVIVKFIFVGPKDLKTDFTFDLKFLAFLILLRLKFLAGLFVWFTWDIVWETDILCDMWWTSVNYFYSFHLHYFHILLCND